MTELEKAARQALEALEQIKQETFHPAKVFTHNPAITALRRALQERSFVEQPAQQVGINGLTESETDATASVMGLVSKTAQQEPVAWMGTDVEGNPNKFRLNFFSGAIPLFTMSEDRSLIATNEKNGSPCPEFWDWLPKAYNFEGVGIFTKYNMEVAFLAGKQSVATSYTSQDRVDETPKKVHEQPVPATELREQEPVAHSLFAGALFDFMGWLTSRKERLVLSSVDDASPAVEVIRQFAEMRCLSLDEAKVQEWQDLLTEQPAQDERLELIGHADLSINNIYLFNGYGEEVPEGRTPIYAGYKAAHGIKGGA